MIALTTEQMRQIELAAACLAPDDRSQYYELVKSQLAPRGIDVEAAVQKAAALCHATARPARAGIEDSSSEPQ